MVDHRRLRSSAGILIAGTVLAAYLVTLIGFGYIGQQRLRDALIEQEQLNDEKQTTTATLFLDHQRQSLEELAGHIAIQTFFANRDLGMSMEYGLRASLNALVNEFRHFASGNRVAGIPVFDDISLVGTDGRKLLSVSAHAQRLLPTGRATDHSNAAAASTALEISTDADGVHLVMREPVAYKQERVAVIAARMPIEDVLWPLLHDAQDRQLQRRSALLGPGGRVLRSSGGEAWHGWLAAARAAGEPVLSSPIGNTGLRLVSLPGETLHEGYISSPWFLAALAAVSIPILAGITFLWRLNDHNLVLRTRYQSTTKQRALLRDQNARLQREINKRLESEQLLVHQANYDQLTGLPNRNLAMDRLSQAIKQARREQQQVLLLFLDLDRFKQVNDSLGHAAGDDLLRQAAQRLQERVRESDTVSRLGGDEFLVICPDMPEDGAWENLAQQLLKCLSMPFYVGEHEFFVGASIGVAAYPEGGDEPLKLLKNADIAMYAAKENGRNRYCLYAPSMDAAAVEAVRLENNLRRALDNRELQLVFQPIVDLVSGRTVAAEALLRWHNPELGTVPPDRFIPVAEETGLIHDIGEWVLREACRQVSNLQPPSGFRVAVNLSSKQFSRPARLLDCVLQALRRSGLMPSQLEIEITESILIDDRPETADLLDQLNRIGVRLSIDDFGTGYSALNYLQRFPFDVLKIDRSFTRQVPQSAPNSSLIRAIIAMAHALGLEVTAEGIENRAQAGFLLIQHCELGQGYLYSRPLPIDALAHHLSEEFAASA